MVGIQLIFKLRVQSGSDALNNPVYSEVDQPVDNCLIAPIIEPITAREQQAIAQSRDQVRIHIPKSYTGDLSNSTVVWNGKKFRVDSSSVEFMNENTPGDWNRYFRAEVVKANA